MLCGALLCCTRPLVPSSSPHTPSPSRQTTNLDGESNLKARGGVKDTLDLKTPDQICAFKGQVVCQQPDQVGFENLDKFESQLKRDASDTQPQGLSASNLLLQATHVRNTDFAYALVVYTGNETKFGKNKRPPPTKFTQTDSLINEFSGVIFLFQLLLVIVFGTIGNLWKEDNGRAAWYLQYEATEPVYQFLIIPLRFLLLNSTMIPISLKVTLDLCKLYYARFINADLALFDPETGNHTHSNSTALSEDLGQIEYVLSDKTGTLTENVMVLKVCTILGRQFGIFDADADNLTGGGGAVRPGTVDENGLGLNAKGMMEDPSMRAQVASDRAQGNTAACALEFLRCIALNNTVIPDVADTAAAGTRRVYKASSPDEEALVDAAAHYGVALLGREADTVQIAVPGPAAGAKGINMFEGAIGGVAGLDSADTLAEAVTGPSARLWVESYTQLEEFEFNSDRKRMSVVVRVQSVGGRKLSPGQAGGGVHNGIRLYVKGADDMVLKLLAPGQLRPAPGSDSSPVQQQIDAYAASGLRTLVMAYKDVSEEEWSAFQRELGAAKAQMQGREEATEACYARMEQNLILLGATAIEDKLQDQVPETISLLKEANIKIWMCTGDKYSTAQTIAQTCALWPPGSELLSIDGNDPDSVSRSLEDHISTLKSRGIHMRTLPEPVTGPCAGPRKRTGCCLPDGAATTQPASHSAVSVPNPVMSGEGGGSPTHSRRSSLTGAGRGYTVIIRGSTLEHALLHHRRAFASVCLSADAVICCRVTPKQKAQLVKVVRDANHITLAIGDGGNDVVMIQEAHIGVGIRGKEGLQAARSSDYAVPFFKALQRLLLVHGRYSYHRTAIVAQYSFYKSFLFCFLQIGFGFMSGFAGVSLFNSLCVAAYNAMLFVPIVYFFLDKDIDEGTALGYPKAYLMGARSELMNYRTFGGWFLRALVQAVIIMAIGLGFPPLGSSEAGHEVLGLIVFFGYLWVQDFTMLFLLRRVTVYNFVSIFGLHALAFGGGILLNILPSFQSFIDYFTLNFSLGLAGMWLANILMTGAACVFVEALRAWLLRSGSSIDKDLMLWDAQHGSHEAPPGTLGGKPGPRMVLRPVRSRGAVGARGPAAHGASDGLPAGARSPRATSDGDVSVSMELPLLKQGASKAGQQKHGSGGRTGGAPAGSGGVKVLADGTRTSQNPLHTDVSYGGSSLDVTSRQPARGADAKGGPSTNGMGVKAGKGATGLSADAADPIPTGETEKRGSMVSDSGDTEEPGGHSDDLDMGAVGGGEDDEDVAALPGEAVGGKSPLTFYMSKPARASIVGSRAVRA